MATLQDIMKDANELHYGKCMTQYFWEFKPQHMESSAASVFMIFLSLVPSPPAKLAEKASPFKKHF